MQTTKQPYELLVRWDQNGQLAGAQVQHRFVTRAGEAVIGEFVGNAEPLKLGDFPLSELLNQAQADALAKAMQLQGLVAELEMSIAERDQAIKVLQFELKEARNAA